MLNKSDRVFRKLSDSVDIGGSGVGNSSGKKDGTVLTTSDLEILDQSLDRLIASLDHAIAETRLTTQVFKERATK